MADRCSVLLPVPKANGSMIGRLEKACTRRLKEAAAKHSAKVSSTTSVTVAVGAESVTSEGFGYIVCGDQYENASLGDAVPHFRLDRKNECYVMNMRRLLAACQEGGVAASGPTPEEEVERMVEKSRKYLAEDSCARGRRYKYWHWLEKDDDEMFVLRHDSNTEIYRLNSATFEPVLVDDGTCARKEKQVKVGGALAAEVQPVWTCGKAFWSGQGTFLVTTHAQGVRLWGAEDFHSVMRLNHAGVELGTFSRNEEYLVTWDQQLGQDRIVLHHVFSGYVLAKFATPTVGCMGTPGWPYVSWSSCSQYLAIPAGDKGLRVYMVPAQKFLTVEDPEGETRTPYLPFPNSIFSWQADTEAAPILAIWTASTHESSPSRLTIIRLRDADPPFYHDKEGADKLESSSAYSTLATRNIFSVDGVARIFWSHGRYCALVTSVLKKAHGKKAVLQTQLDVFTVDSGAQARGQQLAVSSITIEDSIVTVEWSSAFNRFAVLTAKPQVLFFAMQDTNIIDCGSIPAAGAAGGFGSSLPTSINTIAWSPLGTHFVLAGCASDESPVWFGVCTDVAEPPPSASTLLASTPQEISAAKKLPVGASAALLTSSNPGGGGTGKKQSLGNNQIPGLKAATTGGGGSRNAGGGGHHQPQVPNFVNYKPEIINKAEKNKLRSVEWDPSGRYVCTAVFSPVGSERSYKVADSTGFTLWSTQGKAVYDRMVPSLHRFRWRPHPKVCMTQARRKNIKINLETRYSPAFEKKDGERVALKRAEVNLRKDALTTEFRARVADAQRMYHELEPAQEWTRAEQSYIDHMETVESVEENFEELGVQVRPTAQNVTAQGISATG